MMEEKRKPITDTVEIMHRRFIKGDKKRLASIEEERKKLDIAEQVYRLCAEAGLKENK